MKLPVIGLAVAAGIFALDQVVKYLVTGPLQLDLLAGAPMELLPIFQLRFVPNSGISLGFLRANDEMARWLLVAMTAAIAAGVVGWMWREGRRWDQAALGMVLGGALGNILDRVRLGYVVDYADLHFGGWSPFLVFNLADAAISAGVMVLLARAFLVRERPGSRVETKS